jgi:hypothetical protein
MAKEKVYTPLGARWWGGEVGGMNCADCATAGLSCLLWWFGYQLHL